MRIVYFTIDNINDNVILAQTLPMLGRFARLPDVGGIDFFALRKTGGDEYRRDLPAAVRVRVGRNYGIWHPLTWLNLLRLSVAAWACAEPGAVLVGRNPVSLFCLGLAASRRRTRLILDYRGILSEEYVLQGKIARKGRIHRSLRQLERWALGRADGILCVSERLRRRCRGWCPDAAKKAVVIPSCYDPNLARRNDTTATHLRIELGLNSARDFVLVYAGSLSAWNRPDLILTAYRTLRAAHADTKLLLLTGSATEARLIFGREAGVIVRSVAHTDIQQYLALADLGLLLRDRSPVNRVASPVKFAEYLACGVPVLVSPGVGDFAGMVAREGVGFVLREDLPLERVASEVRMQRATLRRRCMDVAARYFDGDRYLSQYRGLITGRAS